MTFPIDIKLWSLTNKNIFGFLCYFFLASPLFSSPLNFSNPNQKLMIGENVEILEDPADTLTPEEALNAKGFIKSLETIPNLGLTSSAFWIKFAVTNSSGSPLSLSILQPNIDQIEFYSFSGDILFIQKSGQIYPFYERKYKTLDYIFDLRTDDKTIYLFKVKSCKRLLLPMQLSTSETALKASLSKEVIFAFYTGIILVMVFYNLFIFLSVKDKSYIFYVLSIISIGLAQNTFPGFAYKYFWPDSPYFAINSTFFTSGMVGLTTIPFFINFLQTQKYLGKLNYLLYTIGVLYLSAIITPIFNLHTVSYKIIELTGLLYSITLIVFGTIISRKGSRPAKFFLIGWSIFLIGVSIYSFKELGILPFNNFTNYTMPVGSVIEVILLSLALADRINILRKENERKQGLIIQHLQENENFLLLWKEAVLNAEKLKKESFRNQVNPHFLFNSLNVLTELLYENQEQAAKFVSQLSQVYRYVLEHKDKEVVELKTELEFIDAFIFLLQIRFDKNLVIKNNIHTANDFMIPPLTLQLLIENAIKHNIVSSQQPLTIVIDLDEDYISVKNEIQIKSSLDTSTGIGLKNIEARYKFLSDKKILVESSQNSFIVKVPILKLI